MQNVKEYNKKQYIMFDLDKKNDDIWYWENTISCSNELCNFLESIDSVESSHVRIPMWIDWTASNDSSTHYGYVKNIFKDSLKNIVEDKLVNGRTRYIINSLLMAVEMCFERYIQGHNLNRDDYILDTHILPIKKWDTGQSMGPHCDNYDGHSNLAFSLVTYLNDSYEGGEINFPNHDITIKPSAGSLVMFPSQEPFVHQVLPIKSGTRYMLTTSVFKK
jgi:hypothetical protein